MAQISQLHMGAGVKVELSADAYGAVAGGDFGLASPLISGNSSHRYLDDALIVAPQLGPHQHLQSRSVSREPNR